MAVPVKIRNEVTSADHAAIDILRTCYAKCYCYLRKFCPLHDVRYRCKGKAQSLGRGGGAVIEEEISGRSNGGIEAGGGAIIEPHWRLT